jgi:plasmid stability protein
MAQFTVRKLEDDVKARLQAQAARHGVSLEEEVRRILRHAVMARPAPSAGLGSRMAGRFAALGLAADESIAEQRGQGVTPAVFD